MDRDPSLRPLVAAKDLQAGKDALRERDYRRMGLGVSVAAIFIVLLGLRLYIRQIEGGSK
jgi:hypothetical protein